MKGIAFNKVFGKKVIFSWVVVRYKVKKLKAEAKKLLLRSFSASTYFLKKKIDLIRSNYLKAESVCHKNNYLRPRLGELIISCL